MENLFLVKKDTFCNIECDFWCNKDGEIYLTRKQIGLALEYTDPQKAIDNIHAKHKERLDKFSVTLRMRGTDGKLYNTILYTAKGVYEICRWSRQPKADAFMDWVWDVIDSLRKGETKIIPNKTKNNFTQNAENQNYQDDKHWKFDFTVKLLKDFGDSLSPEAKTTFLANITEELFGRPMLPKPAVRRTITASKLAERLGISPQKFGRLITKAGNIRNNPKYGLTILDKSKYSDKNVVNFAYFEDKAEEIINILQPLIDKERKKSK
ncbi:BRO family protein (plasmid) [Thermoanaerobacterium thermosaccharolyticum]|uniref:BRO family protein n=1 Tax=Thermoanaerobacterium thermosaccharolyticum TaxID=1517 RepID=UPI003DA87134